MKPHRKSTILAVAFFTVMTLFATFTSRAQNQFRIVQSLPDTIRMVTVPAGWQVKIASGVENAIAILTPCEAFFDEDNEPQVCRMDGKSLEILPNTTMPKNTVLEITLKSRLHKLEVEKNAHVQTGHLEFYGKNAHVWVKDSAMVIGTTWNSTKNLEIEVHEGATLRVDTLRASGELEVDRSYGALMECPTLISNSTSVRSDVGSFGTEYHDDSTANMSVKTVNRRWTKYVDGVSLSFGLSAPITLYMNNTQGSPYNRGESYRIAMWWSILKDLPISGKLTFRPWLGYELNWSRLLNSVAYDGNALALSTPATGELPQQHFLSESISLRMQFNYSFGKAIPNKGIDPYRMTFGLSLLRNVKETLITRTMGTDNRWQRDKQQTDVLNPWQLRAFLSIGGGPLTRGSIGLTYDLLPTFRSGVGADNVHTFGVTLSF